MNSDFKFTSDVDDSHIVKGRLFAQSGGAISQSVTRKERMACTADVQGYSRQEEYLTPRKKKDGLSHVLKRHMIGIYEYLKNIVVLYLLRVKTDHLHKKKTRIFGNRVLVNRLEVHYAIRKRRSKKKSWYCGSSSSSFDGGDRETISAMESKIAYLNAELVSRKKERRREKKERRRERRRSGKKGGREQEVCSVPN
ncbi:hypothetical protein H5410_060647 [Solanum commersonii]|uniref:Uncharacterized protein n=1 Tax=Solanum commersonii TaxID=4109 RepID=A0A9J5W614_SOLCO|nr:hypothetical protein H5410_060647 [Solanum commersonii]